mmetsp:Transcript_948/g.2841  ORF Transcript_948/g.2841 Transcript_948/m.2841 type:complete len:83 (+) Transcript_948:88-336(+)
MHLKIKKESKHHCRPEKLTQTLVAETHRVGPRIEHITLQHLHDEHVEPRSGSKQLAPAALHHLRTSSLCVQRRTNVSLLGIP